MRASNIIPLLVAVVLAAVTVAIGRQVLGNRGGVAAPRDMVQVVVAVRDIEPGSQIEGADVQTAEMSLANLPGGTIQRLEDGIGRVVSAPIFKGQMLVEPALAPPGTPRGLQGLIKPGMRAVTIGVTDSDGLSGFLYQGCHVDVIATLIDENSHQTVARTIVEDVVVSAMGQRMGSGGAAAESSATAMRNITLMVTPKQAAAVELASTKARARLVMRGAKDTTTSGELASVSISDLLGTPVPEAPATQPAPAARSSVEIIKGAQEFIKIFETNPSNATQGNERRPATNPATDGRPN